MMLTINKTKPAAFKHIEIELYDYPDTKKEIERLQRQIKSGLNINSGRSTLAVNKRLRNLEEMYDAIEYVFKKVTEGHRAVIQSCYWNGSRMTTSEVAQACHMHRNTVAKLKREFITLVAQIIGWI